MNSAERQKVINTHHNLTFRVLGLIRIFNDSISKIRKILYLALLTSLFIGLFVYFGAKLGYVQVHGDELYYIGRSMQVLEFYEGSRSAKSIWFSTGNHPLSSQTIMGISMKLQGQSFKAPNNPWTTNVTIDQLIAARKTTLFISLLGLYIISLFAINRGGLPALLVALLIPLSSPGFMEYSMRAMLDVYVASFAGISFVTFAYYVLSKNFQMLIISAVFLGLALGSKTSWDSLAMLGILVVSAGYISGRLKAAIFLAIAMISFSLTSLPIVLRPLDHLKAVMPYGSGASLLENILKEQSLVNVKGYSIFGYMSLPLVLLYSALILTTLIAIWRVKDKAIQGGIVFYLTILAGLYSSISLVLSNFTFEYGRNYVRQPVYEAITASLVIALLRQNPGFLPKRASQIIISVLLSLALSSYIFYINNWQSYRLAEPIYIGAGISLLLGSLALITSTVIKSMSTVVKILSGIRQRFSRVSAHKVTETTFGEIVSQMSRELEETGALHEERYETDLTYFNSLKSKLDEVEESMNRGVIPEPSSLAKDLIEILDLYSKTYNLKSLTLRELLAKLHAKHGISIEYSKIVVILEKYIYSHNKALTLHEYEILKLYMRELSKNLKNCLRDEN
jgi:hypothetical protein